MRSLRRKGQIGASDFGVERDAPGGRGTPAKSGDTGVDVVVLRGQRRTKRVASERKAVTRLDAPPREAIGAIEADLRAGAEIEFRGVGEMANSEMLELRELIAERGHLKKRRVAADARVVEGGRVAQRELLVRHEGDGRLAARLLTAGVAEDECLAIAGQAGAGIEGGEVLGKNETAIARGVDVAYLKAEFVFVFGANSHGRYRRVAVDGFVSAQAADRLYVG